MLSATGNSVSTIYRGFGSQAANRANDEYDVFVLPLANIFRPPMEPALNRISEFVENLTIPTVMLSGGAQSGPDGTFTHLKKMESSVKRFCRAILEKSNSITVRGERTAEYIRGLGFTDVLVIGCPSMTLNGPGHKVGEMVPKDTLKIAYNVDRRKVSLGDLIQAMESVHDATYFPQDIETLEMMLWGVDFRRSSHDYWMPLHIQLPQFVQNNAEFHLDTRTWIHRLKDFDLSLGPRIHGNIAAVLAGTPAVVLAHDTRTLELAEYHEIPHLTPSESLKVKSLDQVTEKANFSGFNDRQTARFDEVIKFLHSNGIRSIYDEGEEGARQLYEHEFASISLPDPQRTEWATLTPKEKTRLRKRRMIEIELKALRKGSKKSST